MQPPLHLYNNHDTENEISIQEQRAKRPHAQFNLFSTTWSRNRCSPAGPGIGQRNCPFLRRKLIAALHPDQTPELPKRWHSQPEFRHQAARQIVVDRHLRPFLAPESSIGEVVLSPALDLPEDDSRQRRDATNFFGRVVSASCAGAVSGFCSSRNVDCAQALVGRRMQSIPPAIV